MFKADIRLRTLEMDEHLGISCEMAMEGVSMSDKMMLMHTLARGLELNFVDLAMFAIAEKTGVFSSEGDIEIRIPKNAKEDTDES